MTRLGALGTQGEPFQFRLPKPCSRQRFAPILVIAAMSGLVATAQSPAASASADSGQFFSTYCFSCHNQKLRTAGVALEGADPAQASANPELWERVIAKLRAGSMPPPGRPRADAATYRTVASSLENEIDRAWAAHPNPGRISAVHRLNRAEYNNAIRDLFALDVDVKPLLPGDETADGSFDNFADVSLDLDGSPGTLPVGGPASHAAGGWLAPGQSRASSDSRSRCTFCRTTGRVKTCRWDRAAASRFITIFRSTASI